MSASDASPNLPSLSREIKLKLKCIGPTKSAVHHRFQQRTHETAVSPALHPPNRGDVPFIWRLSLAEGLIEEPSKKERLTQPPAIDTVMDTARRIVPDPLVPREEPVHELNLLPTEEPLSTVPERWIEEPELVKYFAPERHVRADYTARRSHWIFEQARFVFLRQ